MVLVMDSVYFARRSMYMATQPESGIEVPRRTSCVSFLADEEQKSINRASFSDGISISSHNETVENKDFRKKQVRCGDKNYTILGRGAAKTVLKRDDVADKVYLIANNQFKVRELQEEFNLTKMFRQSIESNVIIDEIKIHCDKNKNFSFEEKKSIFALCEALRGVYGIDKLRALYNQKEASAIREIMAVTGADQTESDKILYLLGYFKDSPWDLGALMKKAKESQSNIAVDLEELPESVLQRYAISSSRAVGDLDTFLEKKELSYKDRYDLCCQVLTAIEQFHSAGFIHGDLKPDNFLIYENEEGKYTVKLSDFGKTRKASSIDSFRRWGNPRYIGPENRSSMLGEVYGVALVCLRILEAPLLSEGGDSLIEPSVKAPSIVQSKKTRKGVEKYLLNSGVTVQIEQKTFLEKIIRIFKIFFSSPNFQKVEKEVYRYIEAMEIKLREKEKEEGVSDCLCFFPFLHNALSSNPEQRPFLYKS
jgi:serine/threonine protein kinase